MFKIELHNSSFKKSFALAIAMLLAVVSYGQTWTGNSSSDWNNASNWSGGMPSSNSSVTIPGNRPNQPEITSNVTVKNLTIGDWNNSVVLSVNGGQLTVSENVTLTNYSELKLVSGSILFDRTKNNASFSWAYTDAKITLVAGTFTSDLVLSVNGSFNSGSANVYLNGDMTISNGKTVTSGSSGTWYVAEDLTVNGTLDLEGASLDVSGTFTVGSGGVAYAGNGNHHFRGTFDVGNNGTFHNENAYSIIYNSISAKNSAAITVDNGTLEFRANVDLFSTASLTVTGTGTVSIVGSGDFKQNGNLSIGDGTLAITGDVNFSQGGSLDVNSGNVSITGNATFSQSGTMTIESGSLNIQGDANFDQSGTLTATEANITVSGNLSLGSNGSEFNAGSSTINLEGGTFTNNGTFNADSSTVNFTGTSSQTIEGDVTFFNVNFETSGSLTTTGSVTVLNDAAINSSTSVSVASGETLEVQGNLEDPSGNATSNRPFVRSIVAVSANQVKVEFSEPITTATGNTASNFSLTPTLSVSGSSVEPSGNYIVLTLSGNMTEGVKYTFVLNSLVGQTNGQTISTNHTRYYTYVPPITTPTGSISQLTASQIGDQTATLTWKRNDAAGTVVVIREKAAVVVPPTDLASYTANNTFGQGSLLGSNAYVVYAGTDTSVVVNGLNPNVEYHISAFAYNGTFPLQAAYNTANNASQAFTTSFKLNLKVFLLGAVNDQGTAMSSKLIQNNALPLNQPYSGLINYTGPTSMPSYPSNDIVDWVKVEIRKATAPSSASSNTIVAQIPALLKVDGSIVGLDGTSLINAKIPSGGSFVVIIYHRNHLPVLSGDTLTVDEAKIFSLDFTNSTDAWYETNSAVEVANGIFCASSGKSANGTNYEVDASAYQKAWNNRNTSGYLEDDVNMDGAIDASDRAKIFNSRNKALTLPETANAPQ